MTKQKIDKNYLDYIPVKNPDIEYETNEKGTITVFIRWEGFFNKIAQKFFHRPKVSSIDLDDYGSFVWGIIDDKKDIYTLSKELDQKFPNMEKSLSRLIKFLEILKDHHLIALLDGRDGIPLKEWLKSHTKVRLVARDRANAYAAAIFHSSGTLLPGGS